MIVDYEQLKKNITPLQKELYIEQVLKNPYIPPEIIPYYEQMIILLDEIDRQDPRNRLVAGGAYSGKSELVAIDVCRFLMYPDYRALLLRNTLVQMKMPGEVKSKLERWLCDEKRLGDRVCTHNKSDHYFKAPSGAEIHYGGCDSEQQMDKYRGSSYNRLYLIEASEINGVALDFLNRSVRPPEGSTSNIQEMCMYVSNPSFGPGVDYLKRTFIDDDSPNKYYNLDLMMNPYVPRERYDKRLSQMDAQSQAFMRFGDWNFVAQNGLLLSQQQFDDAQIQYSHELYDHVTFSVIGIDPAGDGEDYCSLTHLLLLDDGHVIIDDNVLLSDSLIEEAMYDFTERQKEKYPVNAVIVEGEGGSMGVYGTRHFRNALNNLQDMYPFEVIMQPIQGKGKKFKRAEPVAYGIRQGIVKINYAIPNKLMLNNQFMYITPVVKKMKELPSPDFLDSVSLAYNWMISELDIEEEYQYKRLVEDEGT